MSAGRQTRVGRLTKRPEFLRVAAGRRKWVTPGMVVQARARHEAPPASAVAALNASEGAAETDSAGPPRVGITVSRKVGNAVQRNRARRRLRAAAREALPEVGAPGVDYVLIGRAGTLSRAYPDLLADLQQAVDKLNRPGRPRSSGAGTGRSGTRRRKSGRPRDQAGDKQAKDGSHGEP
ncbi:ribonuclease P protein component [Rhodovibrio salinarum]|uniref:Ribonuclease P protein component n=1 Tax=Rhodovibrio salinarum TaxID=1087 RepID=A0A934QGT2_9PROT|nr:ribonuclease P protein component [Rhodovibrio salinarum]MBK1696726.1 ribonuclease P protein component [Rhodovibrio salinarum]